MEGELGTKSVSLTVQVPHCLSAPPFGVVGGGACWVRMKARAVIPFLLHGQINCDCHCGTW